MKKTMIVLIMMLAAVNIFAMGTPDATELLEEASTYQIRVFSSFPTNIQGLASYYDSDGNAQTTRFFGITPMVYEIASHDGLLAVVRVNPAAPSFGWMSDRLGMADRFGMAGGNAPRIRAILFKGNKFIVEKSSFANFNEITLTNGRFPYRNLGFMLLP